MKKKIDVIEDKKKITISISLSRESEKELFVSSSGA